MSNKSKLTSGVFSNRTDEWKTPTDLYKKLNAEFKFVLDAAATSTNALCNNFFTKKDNALTKDWSKYKSVFCNPPYSQASEFVEKSLNEAKKGCTVVMLIPFRSDTKYYHDFIINKAKEVRLIKGRLHYSDSEQTAPFPSAIIVFENTNKKTQFCSTSKQGVKLAGIKTLKEHLKKTNMTNHEYLRQQFGKNKGGTADFSPDTWEVANEVYIMEKEYDDEGFDIVKRINNGDEDEPEYEFEVLKSIYLDEDKNTIQFVASEARKLAKNTKLKGTNMITPANYFDEIDIILDRLPSEVKEAHQLVSAMKNDGIDNPFNTGDKDIDDMGKLLLEKANAILAKSESKAAKPTPVKSEKPRGIKITKVAKPKSEPKKSEKSVAKKPTKKRVVKKSKPSKKSKTISRKTAQKVTRKAIKQTRKADAAKPSVTKKIFSKELQIVKAFIANDGKEVSVGVLKAKHAAAKNAVKDGKTNQHQEVLRNIIVRYGKAIGAIKGTATHIKCNVEKGFLLKLKAIVADAKVKVRTDFLAGVKKGKKKVYYDLLSPDGISMFPNKIFKNLDEVEPAFEQWKKRFERQGYYSSNNGRIHLDDLADEMQLIEIPAAQWDAENLTGKVTSKKTSTDDDNVNFIVAEFKNTKPYFFAESLAEYLSETGNISDWLNDDDDDDEMDEESKVQIVADAIKQNNDFSEFDIVDAELVNHIFINSDEFSKKDLPKFVKWLKKVGLNGKK